MRRRTLSHRWVTVVGTGALLYVGVAAVLLMAAVMGPVCAQTSSSSSSESSSSSVSLSSSSQSSSSQSLSSQSSSSNAPGSSSSSSSSSSSEENHGDPEDIGQCICDMTGGKCDPNCCCDPSCDDTDASLFTECLPEGPPDNAIMCVDEGEIVAWNHVTEQNSFVENQLCVAIENNPLRGYFYETENNVGIDKINSAVPSFSFRVNTTIPPVSDYKYGDQLLAQIQYTNNVTQLLAGVFSLPTTDPTGVCSDSSPALFLVDVLDNVCMKECQSTLANDCNNSLSHSPYVDNLFVCTTSQCDSVVPITKTKVTCFNATGPTNSSCSIQTGLPSTYYDSATGICENALRRVFYHVVYSGSTIEAVEADIEVGPVYVCNPSVEFKINYRQASQSLSTISYRSGNPGYVYGKQVLLGQLVNSTITSMDYHVMGVTGGSLQCTSGAGPLVTFGDDSITSCTYYVDPLSLNVDSSTVCSAFVGLTTPLFVSGHPSLIAAFGNASTELVDEWISISDSPPTLTGCQYISELQLTILASKQGNVFNPQNKIVAAQFAYITSNLISDVKCVGTMCQSPFPIDLRMVVSFSWYVAPDDELVAVAPPALPDLPDDIFLHNTPIQSVNMPNTLPLKTNSPPFAYPGNHPSPYNGTWLGADKWFISDSPESEYRLTLTNSATGEVVPCYTATYQNYLKQAANSKWMVVHTRSGEGEDDGVVIIIERLDDVKVKPEDTRVTVRVPVLDCTSMVYFMQMSASDPDELMVIFEQNVDEMESYFVFVVVDVAKSHAKKDLEMVTMTTCSPPSFGSQVARQAMALRKKNGERCLVVKTIFGFDTMEIYYLEDGARRLQRLTTKVLYSQLDMTQLDESRFCLCTEKPGQIAEIWDCNDLTHPSEVIELSRDGSPGSTVHASRGLLVKCQGNCVEVIHAASARSLLTITVPCARLAVHAVSSV
ncbi:tectonic protein [Pelomyxa schiedti]|nr:tectonic protein [Pelomyxa schiedti]